MGFQVAHWRLNEGTLSHSRMSAGKEFQTDGAGTEKARRSVDKQTSSIPSKHVL